MGVKYNNYFNSANLGDGGFLLFWSAAKHSLVNLRNKNNDIRPKGGRVSGRERDRKVG